MLKLMSASRVLHVPALVQSTLLSISKPGGGTWPIAIGEVWYSLDGLCAFAPCKDLGQSLAPLQLGVVVPGGARPICHAFTAGITAKQSCFTLQLDLRNAFNTLSCQQMLQPLAQLCLSLLPLATWLYATPTPLWLLGPAATIMSKRGANVTKTDALMLLLSVL